jgi:uncharacterized membrane protein YhaH (DUF805 family)
VSDVSVASPPLNKPLYGASFGQAVSRFWRNYVNFSGRASRSEYWWVALFVGIISIALSVLALVFGGGHVDNATGTFTWGAGYYLFTGISYLWSLAVLLPGLGVAWRRLHDTNRSGAFYFLVLIPFIGAIILLVFMIQDSNPAGERFDRP